MSLRVFETRVRPANHIAENVEKLFVRCYVDNKITGGIDEIEEVDELVSDKHTYLRIHGTSIVQYRGGRVC